jgi:hypothetical protein
MNAKIFASPMTASDNQRITAITNDKQRQKTSS